MLYLLKLKKAEGWDCSWGFVIRANDTQHARKLASKQAGDEGSETWLRSEFSSCRILGANGSSGVILRDFNAG